MSSDRWIKTIQGVNIMKVWNQDNYYWIHPIYEEKYIFDSLEDAEYYLLNWLESQIC
jgi:hypothetical protein